MAYLMMKGHDYPRYGSLLRGFGAQFLQYPKGYLRQMMLCSIAVKSCRNTKFEFVMQPKNESLMQLLKESVHCPFGAAPTTMILDMTGRLGV